jgi:hypothetical protein
VWLFSDATRYDDRSMHLDHMTGSTPVLAATGGAVAIACLAQTHAFLGYTAPG